MKEIDPTCQSTYEYNFSKAFLIPREFKAFEMQEDFRIGNLPGEKGDFLVIEKGKPVIVKRKRFRKLFTIDDDSRPDDFDTYPEDEIGVFDNKFSGMFVSRVCSTYIIKDYRNGGKEVCRLTLQLPDAESRSVSVLELLAICKDWFSFLRRRGNLNRIKNIEDQFSRLMMMISGSQLKHKLVGKGKRFDRRNKA